MSGQAESRDGAPRLLSGGNPQIAKGHGDAPVQAWIKAAPGWKGEVAKRLDRLIEREVPKVKKAVKWNTPLYGLDGETWFLSYHAFDRYLKVAFMRGADIYTPRPRITTHPHLRCFNIPKDPQIYEMR